ncbi:MAG: hypothetical protein AB1414_21485 [bacterium]
MKLQEYYTGYCPACGEGELVIFLCGQGDEKRDMHIQCNYCLALWAEPPGLEAPVFPDSPDFVCPICHYSLKPPYSRPASKKEIEDGGWWEKVKGKI